MRENIATLVAEIRADLSPMTKDLASMRGKLTGTVGKMATDLGKQFSQAFVRAAKVGLAGLFAGGIWSVKAASDAAEMRSKYEQVFGELVGDADAFSKDFAKRIGRSVIDTQKYMAEFQDTFQPLGFAREKASELSKQLLQLGTDLASFNNEAESDVMQKLIGTLIGNHENARSWGVIITENTLKQKLLAMGIEGGTEAATEQEKVMARLALLMDMTSAAQGDAERTAGGFANQMRAFMGTVKDTAAMIGAAFLPAATDLVASLRVAAGSLEQHKQKFVDWGKTIAAKTREVVDWVREFLRAHGDMILSVLAATPKILALAAAVKALSVALTLVGAASGKTALAMLATPVGMLTVAVGLLALAFVDARMKGQSFADSVEEWSGALLGFETRVSNLKKALAEMDKTRGSVKDTKEISDKYAKKQAAGEEVDADELRRDVEALRARRDAELKRMRDLQARIDAATNRGREQQKKWQDANRLQLTDISPLAMMARIGKGALARRNQTVAEDESDKLTLAHGAAFKAKKSTDAKLAEMEGLLAATEAKKEQKEKREAFDATTKATAIKWGSQMGKGLLDAGKRAAGKAKDAASGLFGRAKSAALSAAGVVGSALEAEKRLRAGAADQATAPASEFGGLTEYSRQLQMAIGQTKPEVKAAEETADNTSQMVSWLERVVGGLDKVEQAVGKPKPATAS